jgi:hypothetical protein
MNYGIINCYASSDHGYQVKNKIEAVKQWSICRDPTESISVQLQVILKTRRLARNMIEILNFVPPRPLEFVNHLRLWWSIRVGAFMLALNSTHKT